MKNHKGILESYAQNIKTDKDTKRYFIEKDNLQGWIIQCELACGVEMMFFDYKVEKEVELTGFEAEHILELFYCLSGTIEMYYGSSKVLLKENHIGIYNWNHCPDKVIYKKGKFKGISLLLHTDQAVSSIAPYMQGRRDVIFKMQQILSENQKMFLAFGNRNLNSVFLGIIENPFAYDKNYLMLKAMELIFISSKTMNQSRQANIMDNEETSEYRMLCKAKDYIELHIADPITVSDIAYELGIGIKNINQMFGNYENQTVYQYLKIERLKRAKELLLSSDHSVTEIALEVGWNNASKFSTAFKARYCDSPLSYRKDRK